MQVTCLVKRWAHHTTSGGYDSLARQLGAAIVARKEVSGIISRIAGRLWSDQTMTRHYLLDYQFGDFLAEIAVLTQGIVSPPDVLHVLYGDEQLDQLLRHRSLLRSRLVVTFHLPDYRVRHRFEVFQKELAQTIDAAIVVARSQIDSFSRWIGREKVVYIPHGIDTDRFFAVDRLDMERTRIVIVGEHLRDWDVIHRVVDQVNHLQIGVEFHVITKPELARHFTGCDNVFLYTQMPESELIKMYQQADALLLPVVDATANNSVLESLSCGVPVISNCIGGIPDYVNDDCGWLFPRGEILQIVELVKRLSQDKDFGRTYRIAARTQALKFGWQEIARQVSVVYSAVQAGQSPLQALHRFEPQPNEH